MKKKHFFFENAWKQELKSLKIIPAKEVKGEFAFELYDTLVSRLTLLN